MIHARSTTRSRIALAVALAGALAATVAAGCGGSSSASSGGGVPNATIDAVGAENEYANIIEQIGGKYVKVTAIESNPNTDPHTFEAEPECRRGGRRREPAD